jgi:hypothetical protein
MSSIAYESVSLSDVVDEPVSLSDVAYESVSLSDVVDEPVSRRWARR